MMPANEYEQWYRAFGKEAADAEFDRRMRGENLKMIAAGVILCVLAVLVILTGVSP